MYTSRYVETKDGGLDNENQYEIFNSIPINYFVKMEYTLNKSGLLVIDCRITTTGRLHCLFYYQYQFAFHCNIIATLFKTKNK